MTETRTAPTTTTLERQVIPRSTRVSPPNLNEVIGLADAMRTYADAEVVEVVDNLRTSQEAIQAGIARVTSGGFDAIGLIDLEPDEVTRRVIEHCHDEAARLSLAYQAGHRYFDALATQARDRLRAGADAVVAALSADFDRHAEAIAVAQSAGLDAGVSPEALASSGTPAQLKAFRAVGPAVAALDQIASVRDQMTDLLGYGPQGFEALSYVAQVEDRLQLQSAVDVYAGPTEWAQYDQMPFGSALVQVHGVRFGGRWLALLAAGFTLRLNTADSTSAILTAAHAAR